MVERTGAVAGCGTLSVFGVAVGAEGIAGTVRVRDGLEAGVPSLAGGLEDEQAALVVLGDARVRPALLEGPQQGDLEPVGGQLLGDAVPPFDDGDGLGAVRGEVEVIELRGVIEPVGVDVDEPRSVPERGVLCLLYTSPSPRDRG